MKQGSFLLGLLFLFVMLGSGCDQYGEETKTEPKAESEPMTQAMAPPAEEIPMPAGGALNAGPVPPAKEPRPHLHNS